MADPVHIPALRLGKAYTSLDTLAVKDHRTAAPLASVSQVNSGIIRRDVKKARAAQEALAHRSCDELVNICASAAELFMTAELPLGDGHTQSPVQYIHQLSATSGLPHVLIQRNMEKIRHVLASMRTILTGLTRGLDLSIIDEGLGQHAGSPICYYPTTSALAVVLPSNSPGVNSIWLPAIALKVPVLIKPGREEPWTPLRIIHSLIAAGCPAQAFGFYPTDHEGAEALLTSCDSGIIFGDDRTLKRYADNPRIEKHGTGRSKIILGEDEVDRWADHLDLMVESIAANGGRSCINCSTIIAPRHARDIAQALAQRLATLGPAAAADPAACLAAFANPQFAASIDQAISEHLKTPGATDLTAILRPGPRLVEHQGSTFILPTVIHCQSFDHPLANTEYLFPFVAVVELPQQQVCEKIGPSLVVSALTHDEAFKRQLLRCPHIDRLNLGPAPTTAIQWDQPHEGNLFEFLYRRRAIQQVLA